jgi:hypothetical protein
MYIRFYVGFTQSRIETIYVCPPHLQRNLHPWAKHDHPRPYCVTPPQGVILCLVLGAWLGHVPPHPHAAHMGGGGSMLLRVMLSHQIFGFASYAAGVHDGMELAQ